MGSRIRFGLLRVRQQSPRRNHEWRVAQVVMTHTAWYVGGAPAVFTIVAYDNFNNPHTSGGHASSFAVATNPLTVDETGCVPTPSPVLACMMTILDEGPSLQ
jgi:hypothetical protein